MSSNWPDDLERPKEQDVAMMLDGFWHTLAGLPDLVTRGETLLLAELTANLRGTVRDMMLALNGIVYPTGTRHLNTYLSDTQRNALQRTLALPAPDREAWIGQCVALVVIYRWYAPQLCAAYNVEYPTTAEEFAWQLLASEVPEWPRTVTTDPVEA